MEPTNVKTSNLYPNTLDTEQTMPKCFRNKNLTAKVPPISEQLDNAGNGRKWHGVNKVDETKPTDPTQQEDGYPGYNHGVKDTTHALNDDHHELQHLVQEIIKRLDILDQQRCSAAVEVKSIKTVGTTRNQLDLEPSSHIDTRYNEKSGVSENPTPKEPQEAAEETDCCLLAQTKKQQLSPTLRPIPPRVDAQRKKKKKKKKKKDQQKFYQQEEEEEYTTPLQQEYSQYSDSDSEEGSEYLSERTEKNTMRMQLPRSSFYPDEAGLLHHDDLNSRSLDECSERYSDLDSHSNEGSEWIEGNPETNDEENCRF